MTADTRADADRLVAAARAGQDEQAQADPVLDVRDLTVSYIGPDGGTVACRDVSFQLGRGEVLGIAGESGSGKSTLITALTRLQRPPATTTAGSIVFHPAGRPGIDLVPLGARALRKLRWTSMSIVLQSAMDALNPVMRLGDQFADVLRTHNRGMDRAAARTRTTELLGMVGISADRARSFPHEMSGGMRQRATIALALACSPQLVVMDEPTTAVDVVMQRQILAQVLRLRRELGFAVIIVTHDLSLLLEVADRIAIMYAGRIVEIGSARALYRSPAHPYTRGLRDSFPPLHAPLTTLHGIPGTPPDLRRLPSGCPFHPRCPVAVDACSTTPPPLVSLPEQAAECLLLTNEEAS
ncbi:ABC transporter ATP-binding protein [Pseudactinotalea suaedae]|uniref:ABC transporter ATP-binding protein n=1 Tax=Pseudactinotalea suaedae TaxID=1524924 RepID=UPI0012E2FA57|nr:ABC transporter ATP-binding protein [Pseudactinotalea suaedae]